MKRINKQTAWNIFILLMIIGIVFVHAVRAAYTVDFSATNGTFQNYNVVRRLLCGQIPYKDFTTYLGVGHLLTGSIFTFLFGGNFAGSLVAFSFLTLLSFCLISLSLGRAVLGKSMIIYPVTLAMVVVLLVQPLFYTSAAGLFTEIVAAMNAALTPGNSARFVRGMVLPMSLLVPISIYSLLKKYVSAGKLSEKQSQTILYLTNAVVAGACFTWSNDYGIACWLCAFIVQTSVNIRTLRSAHKVIIGSIIYLIANIITILSLISIVTHGGFIEWLNTLAGISEFQRWYYVGSAHYFWDIDMSFLTVLQAVVAATFLIKIIFDRGGGGLKKNAK